MTDIDELLAAVLNDEKLKNSKNCREKIYTDQPLIRRASQIKTPETPQRIREMKAIAYTNEAYFKTSSWLFYTQGCFMADFYDVYEYTEDFNSILPTYGEFTSEQLRGYFSWRRSVREGKFPRAPMPFVYLYAYELINNIGIDIPEKGFDSLISILERCGNRDKALKRSLSRWVSDYAVYYRLPPEYLKKCPDIILDEHMLRLKHYETSSDDEIFEAIKTLSPYDIEKSAYYMEYCEKFKTAAVRCYRRNADYFASHRKNSLFEHYFGKPSMRPVRMFENSIFYDRQNKESFDLEINEIRHYSCRCGAWLCHGYNDKIRLSRHLGDFMKAVDSIMRERGEYPKQLVGIIIPKNTASVIKKELDAIDTEEKHRKETEVKIDLSCLGTIRADADITRDALLTEDDLAELEAANKPEEQPAPEAAPQAGTLLTQAEKAFLTALLNGENGNDAAKKYCSMPYLLADSVNEKLFELFADTVIDMSSGTPEIIDDYREDTISMLENGEI